MAIPSVVATGDNHYQSASNSYIPTIPTGAVEGNLLLAVICGAISPATMTTVPTGWTEVVTYDIVGANAGDESIIVYRAIATSGGSNDPGDSVTFISTDTSAWGVSNVVAIQGHDPASIIHASYTEYWNSDDSPVTLGNITTTNPNTLIIGISNVWGTSVTSSHTFSVSGGVTILKNEGDLTSLHIARVIFSGDAATATTYSYDITWAHLPNQDINGVLISINEGSTLDQEAFRWRKDDGSESAATWEAAQNTNITAATSATKRLRVQIDSDGDAPATQFKLQYRKVGDGSTEWEDVL